MREQNRHRRILLGVSGSLATEQALELARAFVQSGCLVQAVFTADASESVSAQSFEALTGLAPRSTLFDAAHEAAMGHIELARWPDAIVIAPASSNLLAQMAAGMAGDLLTTLCLATDKPVFVAPTMSPSQWSHPATRAHCALLTQRGVRLMAAASSLPAALGDIHQQVMAALAAADEPQGLRGLHAVVTAGPTREPIDPVRFISNRSSGKQGFAVAEALHAAGARVTLIAGPSAQSVGPGITRIDVESAQAMLDASLKAAADADLLVAAAAVADYRVTAAATEKIKKTGETLTLELVKNPDILVTLRASYPGLFLVGFAAETEHLEKHARDKLARKKLDLIAANWVGGGKAFDTEDNALSVFWVGGLQQIESAPKAEVARQLVQLIAQRWQARQSKAPQPATTA
ncbi:MAG: bifunctional phosphopantothenoylcysteine decarboxylase/phosphopantothenate--cysteine ligase CoaBC [Pseudomonadota bacterium]